MVEWRVILLPVLEVLVEFLVQKLAILTDILCEVHQFLQANGRLPFT
jgi:hypothetical protein